MLRQMGVALELIAVVGGGAMTCAPRRDLPPLPARIAQLPLHRGYPVPWFVAVIDGTPDFRVIDTPKIFVAHKRELCWICGQRRGSFLAFVVGPMCAVNRISSEPPSHRECAEFAATACPFLTRPHMTRNEANMATGIMDAAGVGLKRNPGVAMVWVTKSYTPIPAPGGAGVLFQMGDPRLITCYAHGRRATPAEIKHSVETGIPLLMAGLEEEPEHRRERGREELERRTTEALQLLGAA